LIASSTPRTPSPLFEVIFVISGLGYATAAANEANRSPGKGV
jgi:hypothetical protein